MTKVYIRKTSPDKLLDDYRKLTGEVVGSTIKKSEKVILKLNLSWTKFFPACSTPPWQLEGIILGLLDLGILAKNIIPVENKTVVTDVGQGAKNHYWDKVCKKYGVKIYYLTDEKYIVYKPKSKMLVLDKIFEDGITLPAIIFDKPIIHLPTVKMHVFTTTTGAIKNYFGMLRERRHWAHRFIHEAIVDLLAIQKEIHSARFGIMDGSVAGSGSGPRAMDWHETNMILASADLAALDSMAAKIMGFNWRDIKYLRLAEKLGLGRADVKKIEIVGDKKLGEMNLRFTRADTWASRGQKFIYHILPEWVEKLLLRSFIAGWSYFASWFYHDILWYNLAGRTRVKRFADGRWGKLFDSYSKFS